MTLRGRFFSVTLAMISWNCHPQVPARLPGRRISAAAFAGGDVFTLVHGSKRFLNDDRFKIFSGTANLPLAESICKHLDVPLGEAKLGRFSDGEIYFQILENMRGADGFAGPPDVSPAT